MVKRSFRDQREFKAWNDAMVEKFDLDLFHRHPSALVRYVEGKRIRRLFALLAPGRRDRVLEVGCGAGHLLAGLPAGRPFGLDLSDSLLARAAKRLDGRAALVQGDAEHLPFRARAWDRVYCSEVLEHVPDPRAALAEISRVVALHGVAVVSVPNERLINRLKTLLRRTGVYHLLLRARSDYAMPERMDDEWHLHAFDLSTLLAMVPAGFRAARVEAIPFGWLPLRYVVRLEPADREVPRLPRGPAGRVLSHPLLFDLSQRLLAAGLAPVRRRIDLWLQAAPRDRVLDACCGTGNFAQLAPREYLGIDLDPAVIRHACRKYRRDPRKRFAVGDVTSLDFPEESFDLAIFANGLHHLSDAQAVAALRALARLARGPLVVVDPAIETLSPVSRLLLALEQGGHLRPLEAQLALLRAAGLEVERHADLYAGLAHQRIILCRRAGGGR